MIPPVTDIKWMVQNNEVNFVRYHDGQLWYSVVYPAGGCVVQTLEFPVPVSDIGNATFMARDKAILFMRYIRKHLEALNEAQKSQ